MTPLVTLRLRNEQDIVAARQRSRRIAELLQFDSQEQTRIATAVSEIARNAYRYAGGGKIEFAVNTGLEIRVVDQGPGISNLDSILRGAYRSSTGLGMGLTGTQKLMDEFRIDSAPGQGTTVWMRKALPRRAAKLTSSDLNRIAAEITRAEENLYAEVDHQNRELLRTLSDLRLRQDELATLNRELEDTNRGVVALYAELDEKAEHLRQADHLKSTFLSHMSHEFRTPLNSIMALSNILLGRLDGPLTGEQEKQVTFIHNAASELTDMVNDLLDLAKVEAGKIEVHAAEFDIATLLGALRGMMRPLNTNPQVQLVFDDVDAAMPAMFSDEAKVAQILRNLISNALKFTEKGEVRLECDFDRVAEFVVFIVSDSGIGIPPEHQERVFQQYQQVDSARQRLVKGTGLGLPLSRKLAELLGGSITLQSEPGVGSRFTVRMPLRFKKENTDKWSPTPETVGRESSRGANLPRVLIIDDENLTRYLIRKQFSSMPVEIVEAESGPDGLQRAQQGGIDAIILDLVMPDASGFDILAKLKENPVTSGVPVVIHTSLTLGDHERAVLSQAAAIVGKSSSDSELRDVVTSLLAR